MRNRFINALAATATTAIFGLVGFVTGCIIALAYDGVLFLINSDTTFNLMKSGCIGFAAGAIVAIAALITEK